VGLDAFEFFLLLFITVETARLLVGAIVLSGAAAFVEDINLKGGHLLHKLVDLLDFEVVADFGEVFDALEEDLA
jgi:hypothetical protein